MKHIIGAVTKLQSADESPLLAADLTNALTQVRQIVVDEESDGQRLDNFLVRELKGVPKSHVYRIIRSGEVRVNKGRAAADSRLHAGDVLRVPPIRLSPRQAEKEEAMAQRVAHGVASKAIPILYEDDDFMALDKPAGVAVHGGSGVSFGVIEQLRMARPEAKFLELVHRLDRDTSGVLLVAKKRSALTALQDQFRGRETGKTYLALVRGRWPAKLKVLDKPLHKYLDEAGERRVRIAARDDPDGMKALSLVRVNRVLDGLPPQSAGLRSGAATPPTESLPANFSLLEVTIKTGRTHQIRVHLASEGFPIVGDDKYGDFELNKQMQKQGFKRMYLHAWRLSLLHPRSGVELVFHAALPADLRVWGDAVPIAPKTSG